MMITPTAANTASSGWNPIQAQFGGLEADQSGPGGHRQLPGMAVATPLPPPGQQETAADQPGQQHSRHAPVAERTPASTAVSARSSDPSGTTASSTPQPGPRPPSPAPT